MTLTYLFVPVCCSDPLLPNFLCAHVLSLKDCMITAGQDSHILHVVQLEDTPEVFRTNLKAGGVLDVVECYPCA